MTGAHFRRRQHATLRKVAAFLLVFAAPLAVADPAPLPSQPAELPVASTTDDTRIGSSGDASLQRQPVAMPDSAGSDTTVDIEMLRRFNELRRELLDHRAKTVDWWLAGTAILLTLFSVGAFFVGLIGFKRFREIEAEARGYVDRISTLHDKAESSFEGFTAKFVQDNPDMARKAAERIKENPTVSPIDQAVAAAIQLQQLELFEKSIAKWRAVAIIMEGIDDDLAARAWFSVGYIIQKYKKNTIETVMDAYDKAIHLKPDSSEAYNNRGSAKDDLGRYDEAIADYDEAIRLKPDHVDAYNNRGVAKNNLGRHDEAIADYDEAIRLKPDHASAYNNRGVAKKNLGRHDEAIADYDEAIRLKPDHVGAYNNRGKTNISLNRMGEARRDFETAITLARDAGNEALARDAEHVLRKLSKEQDS